MSNSPAALWTEKIQRERQEMLSIYEARDKLSVPVFAQLVGKPEDQINREIKAGRLLSAPDAVGIAIGYGP